MAEKKKKKKKIVKKDDGEQSKRHLQENVMKLKKEIERELSERAYFQLERDKINSFWDITKHDLNELEDQVRNKEREHEEILERHEIEIKVYKQKLRHLLYEQKITLDRLKIENENALKLQSDEFNQKHLQLKTDIRDLKHFLKKQELGQKEHLKEIKLSFEKTITQYREDFERELKQIQLQYQSKMEDIRDKMEEETKLIVGRIEKDKNGQIKLLMEQHKKAFENIKKYYKAITENNLQKVENLNKQVNQMKESEMRNEDMMFEIAQKNKNLSEPLMNHLSEVNRLRRELANYNTDKITLNSKKKKLKQVEINLKKTKWDFEILYQSFQQLDKERQSFYDKYEKVIHDVQQKTLLKNQLLEQKVEAIQDEIMKKEIEMNEVLKLSNLNETDMQNIKQQVQEV